MHKATDYARWIAACEAVIEELTHYRQLRIDDANELTKDIEESNRRLENLRAQFAIARDRERKRKR